MAKELPYFKFHVSEWNDGDITLEDYEVQGLFINICSYYWSNECNITLIKSEKKFRDAAPDLWQTLIDEQLIKVDEKGYLSISFLDEQAQEREKLCSTNADNAKKGWDKRRENKRNESELNATASKPQSESVAGSMQYREEERREEKSRKEEIIKEETKLPILKTKTVFSDEVSTLYNILIPLFPETTIPKNSSQSIKWKDEIRKLLEVDKYDSPTIEHVVRMAREDDFWGGNFLSITKLRKKDKNLIPYIVVFIEKFKHKIRKKQTDFQVHQQAYMERVAENGGIHPSKVDEHGQAY